MNTHVAYHKKLGPKWCSFDEFKKLVATKKWFDSPKTAKESKQVTKEDKKVEEKVDDADIANS